MKKVVHLLLHPVLTKTLRLFQVGFIEAGNWKLHNMDSMDSTLYGLFIIWILYYRDSILYGFYIIDTQYYMDSIL